MGQNPGAGGIALGRGLALEARHVSRVVRVYRRQERAPTGANPHPAAAPRVDRPKRYPPSHAHLTPRCGLVPFNAPMKTVILTTEPAAVGLADNASHPRISFRPFSRALNNPGRSSAEGC
jgi:hypothetical protein